MSISTAYSSLKNWLTIRNVLNWLFFAALLLVLFNPAAKALVIRGLMKIGLFQPGLATVNNTAVPDLSFIDSQGKPINLSSLKGKVVFINFWATWCPPCIAEMPSINALQQKFKAEKNIVFLMVDADNAFNKSVPFMAKHQFNLAVYAASAVPASVYNGSLPTTVLLNKQGRLVFRRQGAADYSNSQFIGYLTRLAGEK
jgi:thiol-disulfide isomerase/thioredoxin